MAARVIEAESHVAKVLCCGLGLGDVEVCMTGRTGMDWRVFGTVIPCHEAYILHSGLALELVDRTYRRTPSRA